MPRGRSTATTSHALDVFAELRAMRERTEAIKAELRARRERALAEVAACDQALAELGAVGERAAAALAPVATETKVAKPQRSKDAVASAGSPKGRAAALTAEARELAPWADCLPPVARQAFDLRVEGLSTKEIATKLGKPEGSISSALFFARNRLREARTKGKPGQTPASDDEGEPAQAPTNDNAAVAGSSRFSPATEEPKQEAPRAPTGWDRADPAEDFTDIEPSATPADPAHVHLWSPESGGTPACTMAHDPAARTTTDRGEATCPTCLAIPEPSAAGPDQRPPAWVLGWLSPEIRRAYEGVALEGLSCQTMAWTEAVSANVISGRVNGARQKIKRLLRWEAEREAEGNPITDQDREPPPAYRDAPDPLLAILRQPGAPELQLPDETPTTPAVERVRAKLTVLDGRIRAKTISAARLSRAERTAGAELDYPADVERPRTRGDCADMPRPCPFVSCSHHLYLEVNPESGAIKLNFPHLEVDQLAETCSLDVADRGGITLEEVGAILNITRERVRQLEVRGLDAMRDGHYEATPDRMGSPLAQAIGD